MGKIANKENEELETLYDHLKNIHEPKELSRKSACEDFLAFFNYGKPFEMYQVDALLIKLVIRHIGASTDEADIILMSLGLLVGYSYTNKQSSKYSCIKFLRESTYLDNKKEKPYDEVDETEQKKYYNTFHKKVMRSLKKFAKLLLQANSIIENDINNIDDYIEKRGKYKFAKLPIPNYITSKYYKSTKITEIKCVMDGERIISVQTPISVYMEDTIVIDIPKEVVERMARMSSYVRALLGSFVLFILLSLLTSRLGSYNQQSNDIVLYDENKPTEDLQKNPPSSLGDLQEEIIASYTNEFE